MQIDIVAGASQPIKIQNKAQEAEEGNQENNKIEDFPETTITKLEVDDFPDLTKESICITLSLFLIIDPFKIFIILNITYNQIKSKLKSQIKKQTKKRKRNNSKK